MPQAIPAVCVRRTSISVQVLPFGLSLSPRVFTKVARQPLFPERSGRAHSQLPRRRLILAQSQDQLCEHRDWCSSHLSQLGLRVNWEKSNSCRCRGSLFSVWSLGFGQSDSAPHAGPRSVGVELLEYIQEQDAAPLKQFQRLLGHMALRRRSRRWGLLHMRPLHTGLHGRVPRLGVAERHAEGPSHSSLPPNLHPVVRPFIPSGRSAPGNRSPARCGLHRRLRQGLGGHVQRACSVRGLDGSPTALAHQLPRVAGSTPGLEPSQETLTRRACTSPYGQTRRPLRTSTDKVVYAPVACHNSPTHLLLWSRKHLRSLRAIHINPGLAQPDRADELSRAALPGEMETPSPDGPADWRRFGLAPGRLFRVPRDVALPVVLTP